MSTKNSIRIKKEYEKEFICACLQCGCHPKKANIEHSQFIFYLLEFKYFQNVFELGYIFAKHTGQRLL